MLSHCLARLLKMHRNTKRASISIILYFPLKTHSSRESCKLKKYKHHQENPEKITVSQSPYTTVRGSTSRSSKQQGEMHLPN